MSDLRISIIQGDIQWEDKETNRDYYFSLLAPLQGISDLAVLPETFSTGFSMNAAHLVENTEGKTIQEAKIWANTLHIAIAGSYLACEGNQLYNQAFLITPDGQSYFYNKRHLFRMGEENAIFTPGTSYSIIPYKGWNIRLSICYDLRFPVWNRNKNNEYDLLICMANWPAVRSKVWSTLLEARAIENMCYVCGVNRIGKDGNGIPHQGDSSLIDFKGKILYKAQSNKEIATTITINKEELRKFREKFPAWKDADTFDIL